MKLLVDWLAADGVADRWSVTVWVKDTGDLDSAFSGTLMKACPRPPLTRYTSRLTPAARPRIAIFLGKHRATTCCCIQRSKDHAA